MDLIEVQTSRPARSREDLALAPGETLLAGGTWLFSEPQPGVTGLVDLTTMGWAAVQRTKHGVRLGATCTLTELVTAGLPLAKDCVHALAQSFKIWSSATVGGNIALALPAGAITALCVGLDATAVIWGPEHERTEPVATLVTGVRRTGLRPGEVLRGVDLPNEALGARTAFRRLGLTTHGRSATVVTGLDQARHVLIGITAATCRPVVLHAVEHAQLDRGLDRIDCWYADPHGPADWKQAMTRRLAHEVLEELR